MKKLVWLLVFLTWTGLSAAQYVPYLHQFSIWGTLPSPKEKTRFLIGVTNGYFLHRPGAVTLYKCLSDHVGYEQAVAMVDKYYNDHPEKWNEAAAEEVIDALTVEGGPCPKSSVIEKAQP